MPSALRHSSMLEVNEYLVLEHVRREGETTRPEIARAVGLAASSVSRLVRRLVDEGLIFEGPGASTGGRPRTVLSFNTRAGCVIGVDLGGTRCHGALADLAGQQLAEDVRPTSQDVAPFGVLEASIDALAARAASLGLPVLALTVGVPAILDPDSGLAVGGPNVRWHGFPIVDRLAARGTVPFAVENDVNLAALAHAWRGDGRGLANFATISIGTGIGAALVIDGRLARGRHNAAGEVGYLVLEKAQLGNVSHGALGSFERLAAGPAITEHAHELLEEGASSSLRTGSLTTEAVFAAARAGDPVAGEVIGHLLDHVAMAVIAVGAIADPELVVFDGAVGRALEPFLAQVTDRVRLHLPMPPRLVPSGLGADATVLGAIAAALSLARSKRGPSAILEAFTIDPQDPRRGVALYVA